MTTERGRYVSATSAAAITGIPERTIRSWVATGKVPAIAGKRGKLLDLDKLRMITDEIGRGDGSTRQPAGNAVEAARSAGESAVDMATGAISIAALQLARIEELVGKVHDQQHEIEALKRLLAEKVTAIEETTATAIEAGDLVDDHQPSYVTLLLRRLRGAAG